MKVKLFVILSLMIVAGCNNRSEDLSQSSGDSSVPPPEKVEVKPFPVTDFILGQINGIKNSPVTLLKTATQNGIADSSWIDRGEITALAKDFLTPVIDSTFLAQNFDGSSFEDLTINAVTFAYSVKENSPKSNNLQEVVVYVKKGSNRVDRIYMVKNEKDGQLQLTWKADNWLTIRKIKGENYTEEKVQWNFESR